ncbi:MAG: hypothetical protein KF725_05600 [Cyclobacteriaceae bacterium]|nr:hypothetical protein [Cyclobacteriaceae bacterium]UYN85949.1 MAG: hypothetical protein KIT51_13880 [Cyclobacteriaceae bacterium]
MKAIDAPNYLKRMRLRYLWLRLGESVLWAVATMVLIFSVGLVMSLNIEWTVFIATSIGMVVFIGRCLVLGIFSVSDNRLTYFINQHYPQLEESADLLLAQKMDLTPLQQLQRQIVLARFEDLSTQIKLPHKLKQASFTLVIAAVLYVGLSSFVEQKDPLTINQLVKSGKEQIVAELPASIKKVSISIAPPSYTNLSKRVVTDVNLEVVEGSQVQWSIQFDGNIQNAFLLFSDNDSIALKQVNNDYAGGHYFIRSGFYQIGWREADEAVKYSDYYKIEVTKDYPPVITVNNVQQFIVLTQNDKLSVNVNALLTDDYGLKEAHIIATVSKGSGESVKFREEKLLFTAPEKVVGKQFKAYRLIDLKKLGLEPGDELYYYIEAIDNKMPAPNRSRTDTYFVSLQDTASDVSFSDGGLGVDLMPEYFRSQRQIIIDSEKLLAEKKKTSKQDFNSRSNELGYDQKVLRLRYGQFLGEEFESGIGIQQNFAEEDDDHDHDDENIAEKYGHVHDKENEHNHVQAKTETPQPKHQHHHTDPNKEESPLDAFLHAHDSDEEATFFAQSIKMKLKAAITVMWDAELHLRLYDPEKSLPYQYKALNLLKEISQDSRIYVHRVGFDPPPLKEEKRLTGDLSELRNSTYHYELIRQANYPSIRTALSVIQQRIDDPKSKFSPSDKQVFLKAGQELSVVALQNPKYIEQLSLLKALAENELTAPERKLILIKLQKAFWEILPLAPRAAGKEASARHALDQQFIKNLEALGNQ